jgi:hypothetical protein
MYYQLIQVVIVYNTIEYFDVCIIVSSDDRGKKFRNS